MTSHATSLPERPYGRFLRSASRRGFGWPWPTLALSRLPSPCLWPPEADRRALISPRPVAISLDKQALADVLERALRDARNPKRDVDQKWVERLSWLGRTV